MFGYLPVLINWSKSDYFNRVCTFAAIMMIISAFAEISASTPYGRFGNPGEGILTFPIDSRVGWFIMELPCSLVFIYQFFIVGGKQSSKPVPRFFAFLFCCHYLYRGWIFPYLIKVHPGTKNFDVGIAFGSWSVTILHAYLNGQWYAEQGTHLVPTKDGKNKKVFWTTDIRFRLGLLMYYTGFVSIIYHDYLMRNLRPCPNGQRYCIPHGGLFEYVTMGSYLSELWCWLGFAIASSGPNGAFIFLVSLVNLVPRSHATHQWYLEKFPEYESLGRARLVPGLW
jgi:3-oxo-5-alpha-steroid 4-dehydrogenase 1